jgi:hypothetical protein
MIWVLFLVDHFKKITDFYFFKLDFEIPFLKLIFDKNSNLLPNLNPNESTNYIQIHKRLTKCCLKTLLSQ